MGRSSDHKYVKLGSNNMIMNTSTMYGNNYHKEDVTGKMVIINVK